MEKKAKKFQLEMNLRSVQAKTQWGCRAMQDKNGLVSLQDNEFVTSVGSRLVTFDNTSSQYRKTHLVDSYDVNTLSVYMMSLSPDSRYLLTLVRFKDDDNCNVVNMLIYNTENKLLDAASKRPRLIRYVNTLHISGGEAFEFHCATFSHDSVYLACGTNIPSKGVIIYDHFRALIIQTISTDSSPTQVSFNPLDSTKVCTVGHGGLFKFWRFTEKSVHAAPVLGLKPGNFTFRCHRWFSAADGGVIIAGTDNGNLYVVQNGAQKAPVVAAFGPGENMSVENILVRGDVVLVVSGLNCVAAFEMRKVMTMKGTNVLAANLSLIGKYRLTNIECINGIQWAVKDSLNSFGVVVTAPTTVFQHELLSDAELAGVGLPKPADEVTVIGWTDVSREKVLHSFHKTNVHTIALSTQSNTFITASYDDATLRYWDFNNPYSTKACELIESFHEKTDENPFHLDMHPSGLFVVTACEYEVREYAITDSALEMMRKISVKLPFTGPNGVPYLVTQPVSIVRYSHGGHYLAVVTGKLAQIFHLFNKDFSSTNVYGSYARVMILCDHIAPITDLRFMRDDATIITTSTDGSVYSWAFGAATRESEYVCKGIAATGLAISKSRDKDATIVACFENVTEEVQPLAAVALKARRQSSIVSRKTTRTPTGLNSLLSGITLDGPEMKEKTVTMNVAAPKKKCFMAVWSGKVTLTPKVIHVDSPIKTMCLGDTDGVDKYEICVLGLEDGRIVISVLPFPFRVLDGNTGGTPYSSVPSTPMENTRSNVSTTGTIHLTRASLIRAGSGKSNKKGLLSLEGVSEVMSRATDRSDLISTGTFSNSSKNLEALAEGSAGSPPHTSHSAMSVGPSHANSPAKNVRGDASALTINTSAPTNVAVAGGADLVEMLDDSRCKVMRLHVGAVNQVAISANGMWIFTVGVDGAIFLLSTSKRAFDYHEIPEQPESIENRYLIVDKKRLHVLKRKLAEIENNTEQTKKDNDMMIAKIIESKEKKETDLRIKMKQEINKRDEAIMLGRREYLQLKNIMKSQIDKIHKEAQDKISDLELVYEKKLSQESMYLDKMKQAYDEHVIHTRMDLVDVQKKANQRIELIEQEKLAALRDAEKQKAAVLQYMDYVKGRNDEVISGLEEQQVAERYRLKHELASVNKTLTETVNAQFSDTVVADLQVSKLKLIIDNHQNEELKLKSAVDWANNRIMTLETSLHAATTSLTKKEEYNAKWEFRSGEQEQKIVELEKIRKALTSQLHNLRLELGPKDETLTKVTDKLSEMQREYEMSLHALAEKEKELSHKGVSIGLLQKQVRELRNSANRKDQVLRRSSNLLDQYKFALQQAYFVSEKRTTGAGPAAAAAEAKRAKQAKSAEEEIVEIIAQNDGMKVALKRLTDILAPYLVDGNLDAEMVEEAEQVQKEQERHMSLLHSNVSGLRANLDVASKVAATKVQNHLSDNQALLKEVNALRLEVRSISMENQRLQAQLEFNATQKSHKEFLHSQHKHAREKTEGRSGKPQRHTSSAGAETAPLRFTEDSDDDDGPPLLFDRRGTSPDGKAKPETEGVKNFLMENIEKSLLTISLQESAQFATGGTTRAITPSASSVDPASISVRAPQPEDSGRPSMADLNQRLGVLSSTSGGIAALGAAEKPMSLAERKIAALIEMNLSDISAAHAREEAALNPQQREPILKPKTVNKDKKAKTIGSIGGSSSAGGGGVLKIDDELNMNSLASNSLASLSHSQSSIQLGSAKFALPPVHNNNTTTTKLLKR